MNASYAPDIPVHTELSILHIVHFVYLYILFFIIRVLSCRTVELLSLNKFLVCANIPIKLILILICFVWGHSLKAASTDCLHAYMSPRWVHSCNRKEHVHKCALFQDHCKSNNRYSGLVCTTDAVSVV